MPRASDLLFKAHSFAPAERRVGKKPGEVRARTLVGGRSYDHVRTQHPWLMELHPSNISRALGTIAFSDGHHAAYGTDSTRPLGVYTDHHKAARAIVQQSPRTDDGDGDPGGGAEIREGGYV